MKQILNTTLVLCASILLSSCGSMFNQGFSHQRYTGFKQGDGGTISKKVTPEPVLKTEAGQKNIAADAEEQPTEPQVVTANVQSDADIHETSSPAQQIKKDEKPDDTGKISPVKSFLRSKLLKQAEPTGGESDINTILLVLLCIFLPPIAILLVEGVGTPFWIDLVFWLLGFGYFGVFYLGLFTLIAIIYAFIICF